MWARNVLFVLLCGLGFAAVAGSLLEEIRLEQPLDHDTAFYQHGEFRNVVDRIDQQFHQHWQAEGIVPAPQADDLLVARRLSLSLTGTPPSLEETRALEQQPLDTRTQWYLSHLFQDRRYSDYLAERFSRAFVGTDEGPFLIFRRRRFVTRLGDQLHENAPYDDVVRQLIAETGVWTSTPAVNFVTATFEAGGSERIDPVKLTSRITRAFLGVRLDCVQCHDDMLDGEWEQTDFHEMAAFFAEAEITLTGLRDQSRDYRYKYLHQEEEQTVSPHVPFATDLHVTRGNRREQIAAWITHPQNPAFARATVNRVWAFMFGRPLVEPIDDILLEGPYPPAMEVLAQDLVSHEFDLQRTIRLIAASKVFQTSSQAEHVLTERHEQHWACFPLTRLRPEQVAGAVLQSASLKTIDASSHIFVKLARFGQQNEFVQRYGDTGADEFNGHSGTIPQRLLLMNGDLVKEKTKDDLLANASTRIAKLAPSDESAVETAYLVILTRRSTEAESDHFAKRLCETRGGQRVAHMEDLYWTLTNSTEFSWNH